MCLVGISVSYDEVEYCTWSGYASLREGLQIIYLSTILIIYLLHMPDG